MLQWVAAGGKREGKREYKKAFMCGSASNSTSHLNKYTEKRELQHTAVCGSVWQCAAVCGSV